MTRTPIFCLTLALLALSLNGCATTMGLFKFQNDFPKTGPKNPAIKVLPMWQPAEGVHNNKPTRGFIGQICILGQNSDAVPAEADGTVRIYVFDDQGTEDEQAKPIHEWDYSRGAWKALLFKGPLGATYGMFVPYTRPGRHEAKCALRVRFTPANGGSPVYSEMITVVLDGSKKAEEDSPAQGQAQEARSGHDAAGTRHRAKKAGNSTESAAREAADRKLARTRNLSQPLPTRDELEKLSRRRSAPPLDAAERERIIREARARLEAEGAGDGVSLVSYEEDEPVRPTRKRKNPIRPSRNPLKDAIEADDQCPADEDSAGDSAGTVSKTGGRHILDDHDEDEVAPAPQPVRSSKARVIEATERTRTGRDLRDLPKDDGPEDYDTEDSTTSTGGGTKTYTIRIPEWVIPG